MMNDMCYELEKRVWSRARDSFYIYDSFKHNTQLRRKHTCIWQSPGSWTRSIARRFDTGWCGS